MAVVLKRTIGLLYALIIYAYLLRWGGGVDSREIKLKTSLLLSSFHTRMPTMINIIMKLQYLAYCTKARYKL